MAVASIGAVQIAILQDLLPVIEAHLPGWIVRPATRDLPQPDEAYAASRSQYEAEPILERLSALGETADRILGVVDLDLYAPGLNFVFGQAQPGGPAAVVALARLRPEFWGEPPNADLLQERAVKEAVHELAHTWGLGHCADPTCVMFFSSTLGETDRKSNELCTRHAEELSRSLRPAERQPHG
ncbi:MAG: archaemetzincin family Zn-dependent metalloprotease [Chloroflexi bacterium]|nr:archaemetzincin family Zn-dependent metalloprotease [Chloroflexota bacterium]